MKIIKKADIQQKKAESQASVTNATQSKKYSKFDNTPIANIPVDYSVFKKSEAERVKLKQLRSAAPKKFTGKAVKIF